jgi:CheY-like chemotaxis protein
VFEPFFTTKEIGAGSGLGLSMVHGFAKQSAGSVFIESQIGKGTSVTLYLPRSAEVANPASSSIADVSAGCGTILLVEDDAAVMLVTAEMLELSGYSVLRARNATEALERFDCDGNRIDILVTDLVLPDGLNGIELATAINRKRPELPVLLVTGYSEALLKVSTPGMSVLTKPFGRSDLTRAVQQALDMQRENLRPRRFEMLSQAECDDRAATHQVEPVR